MHAYLIWVILSVNFTAKHAAVRKVRTQLFLEPLGCLVMFHKGIEVFVRGLPS